MGSEVQVNSATTGSQITSSVASDALGNYVITWTNYSGADGIGVYAQRYSAAGAPQGSEFKVNTSNFGDEFSVAAMDADGDFVIAWHNRGRDGNSYGVYARSYDAAGIPKGDEFQVNTYTAGAQLNAATAMASNGDFVIVWESNGQDNSQTEIYAQRYNASGAAQGSEFRVNSTITGNQYTASVAMDAGGNFVVVWQGTQGGRFGVYSQQYNPAGMPQGSEGLVNTFSSDGPQWMPSVAMATSGNYIVTWESYGQDGSDFGIFAQRFSASGGALGSEFQVNTQVAGAQRFAVVTAGADGFVISWQSLDQDGSGQGVYAQCYSTAGVTEGDEFRVNSYTNADQVYPSISADANGNFIIAWESSGQDGSDFGIYAQRYRRVAAGPDLIVENVGFSPATVFAGSAFTETFRIRNVGSTASPQSQARLRLSEDSHLTLYDKGLSPLDVSIPAIPPGGFFDFARSITVPAGTLAGTYYVGVFADALSTAGQSDETNDAGLSAQMIEVTSPVGTIPPTITRQPVSQQLNVGAAGALIVEASGSDPVNYTWYHGRQELYGQSGRILSFSAASPLQAGQYTARVSNAAGFVLSNTVTLTITGSDQSSQPGGTVIYSVEPIHRDWPTVVITHGWQPLNALDVPSGESLENDLRTGGSAWWFNDLALTISLRVSGQQAPLPTHTNVLVCTWADAFSLSPWSAKASTDEVGNELADQLVSLLGFGYAQNLQFIGHSYGTVVNAEAVHHLQTMQSRIDVEQFTILDAPSLVSSNVLGLPTVGNSFFYDRLPDTGQYAVKWVDNYYGGILATGTDISGAAPGGGKFLPTATHTTVHDWYAQTIPLGGAHEGFETSAVLNGALDPSRLAPLTWTHPGLISRIIDSVPSVLSGAGIPGWSIFGGVVTQRVLTVAGRSITGLVLGQFDGKNLDAASVAKTEGTAASPVTSEDHSIGLDMTIPANATALTFDYRFDEPGDGDWLAVSFNDTPMMNFTGSAFGGTEYQKAIIPLGALSGQSGVFSIVLHTAGTANDAQIAVTDFRFIDEAPPVVVKQSLAYGPAPRVEFVFSEDLSTVSSSDFSVLNLSSGQVPAGSITVSYDVDAKMARLAFPGYNNGLPPNGKYRVTLSGANVRDLAGNVMASDSVFEFTIANHTVLSHQLFYNNSVYDNFNGSDDAAIATDKIALVPGGGKAGIANISSYDKGINGVMLDVAGLPAGNALAAADFAVDVSTDGVNWTAGPAPTSATVRVAGGGSASDRITIIWPDNSIRNKWLRLTMKATPATGLAVADVSYWGSAVGDTGNGIATDTAVNIDSADYYGVRDHLRSYDKPNDVTWNWDINRDGVTDITDIMLVRASATTASTALKLITVPQPPATVQATTTTTGGSSTEKTPGQTTPTTTTTAPTTTTTTPTTSTPTTQVRPPVKLLSQRSRLTLRPLFAWGRK